MIDFTTYLNERYDDELFIDSDRLILACDLYEWLNNIDNLNEDVDVSDDEQDKGDDERDKGDEVRADEWFKQLTDKIYSNRKSKANTFTNYRKSNAVMLGRVYAFRYDPKNKNTLSFFDETPLVIPFDFKDGVDSLGFLGINLHFIPRYQRKAVIQYFIKKNPEQVMKQGKIDISYVQDLKNNPKFKYVYYCIRHYLLDHVRGGFYVIPQEDYINVIDLYSGKYIGKSESEIINIIKNSYTDSLMTPRIKAIKKKREERNKKRRIAYKNKQDKSKLNTNVKPVSGVIDTHVKPSDKKGTINGNI